MFLKLVAGGIVSQAIPAAMSHVLRIRRHGTSLNIRPGGDKKQQQSFIRYSRQLNIIRYILPSKTVRGYIHKVLMFVIQ